VKIHAYYRLRLGTAHSVLHVGVPHHL